MNLAKQMVVVVLLLLGVAAPACARTWRVMRDGTGDYATIQPAVDAASPGDTILIGPGRYTEHTPFWPGPGRTQKRNWPLETYVAVRVDSLTLRGVGRDQTIIGPAVRNLAADELGIVNLAVGTSLTIRDLQAINLFNGCYLYGKVRIDNCLFQTNAEGAVYWSPDGMSVTSSEFRSNATGVITYDGAANPTISGCHFTNNHYGVGLVWTQNGLVTDCVFDLDYVGVQFEQNSSGTIRNCRINAHNACIAIIGPSAALITGNTCTGHHWGTVSFSANVTATGNVFSGGDLVTVQVCDVPVHINGNHIIKGAGRAVQVGCSMGRPLQEFDMINNYWGTSSPDSIRAWIYDHNDDPGVYGVVNFEPFSSTPLPTEKKSLGGVKGLYR